MRYDGTDPMPIVPSRRLGDDTRQVYGKWLGLPNDEIETLLAEDVICKEAISVK